MKTPTLVSSLALALLLAAPASAQDMEPGDGMGEDSMGNEAPAVGGDAKTKDALAEKAADPAPGVDHLHLKDGRLLKGRITAEDDEAYAVKVGATIRVIAKSDVDRIEKGPPAPKRPAGTDAGRDAKRQAAGKKNLSPAALDWARRCLEWVQAEDPTVRRSAAAALTALGPAVVPHVRAAMKKAEGPYKDMLARIADQAAKQGQKKSDRPFDNPGADMRRNAGRLARSLNLSQEQRGPFAKAFGQYMREAGKLVDELRGGFITGDQAIQRAGDLRGTLRSGLEGTLTDEQLQKLDKQLDKMSRKIGAGKNAPKKKDRKPKKDDAGKSDA